MVFSLALRNTRLYFRKRLPLALFLAATLALLFLGNTVFFGTDAGLSSTYKASLTGDLAISAQSEDSFNLFGSELPLLGEYFKMPVILNYDQVEAQVRQTLPQAQLQPLVVGVAKLSLANFSAGAVVFSSNLSSYMAFFSGLTLIRGACPELGHPGILLNDHMYAKLVKDLGREPDLGEGILLTAAQENSFALRQVPLAGVFRYPVYDPIFENICLLDAGTGRALAGYFITQAAAPTNSDEPQGSSIDDLFSDATDTKAPTNEGIDFHQVTEDLKADTTGPVEDTKTWNFLLLKTPHPDSDKKTLTEGLMGQAAPLDVRDWRDTAGGNAKIVWFIQLLFNLGLVFVSLVAGLIVMNSMSLAVAERTKEIGTMRSLGAQQAWVARLVSYETILLVVGSGTFGVLVGSALVVVVDLFGGIHLDNPFLASLLGTQQYRPTLSGWLMVGHVALCLVLGILATILPARKSLRISPLQAMARD